MAQTELSIKKSLKEAGAEAYLMIGDLHSADIFYATHFLASDAFAYLQTLSGKETLFISEMEKGRAELESRVSDIKTLKDFGYREKIKEKKDAALAYADCLSELLGEARIKKLAVPYDFPVYYANILTKAGFSVLPIKNPFRELRKVKGEKEIEAILEAQQAGEAAMQAATALIGKAEEKEGFLWHEGSELTGKKLLSLIDHTLLDYGCEAEETIVSCGADSSNPHGTTLGPLRAKEPIILDIFPRSKKKRYFADMTRTVLYGKASKELKEMYAAVLEAQETALKMIKPGIKASEIHSAVCKGFEKKGYDTYQSGAEVGFIHSTGHGVGLEIHELPGIGENENKLEAGNIITIEPGLYYPKIGGIRLEDMVLVTEKGCENLTNLEKKLEIGNK
ncbi:MAG: Xaa-Pro peptidase family protein [Methanosarcinaceae archaeon]|nr:Xaa-Pro peptidase family protein [Methanosarcinaceae archaeon]MDD4330995.1 Xaa-Pro peptidase family protein [Methanosarcinaceae archaeon]